MSETGGSSRWAGLELRHLAALIAIAETRSFLGAAQRLGYTQSTVSEQIAGLERIVGEILIERPGGPKRVSLTPAGRLLLSHAAAVIARLGAAEADMRALSLGQAGSLTVGTYQSVSRRILPPLLDRFAASWSGIDVTLTESADDADFFPLLQSGDLDLAFAMYPLPEGPFEAVELLRDPYVLVVLRGVNLAEEGTFPALAAIAGLRLIGFRQHRSVAPLEAHLRARGLEPRIVFRSDDYGTVEALVARGMGAALVPRLTVAQTDPRVVVRELHDDLPARRIILVWHRDRSLSPAALAFITEAVGVCREIGEDERPETVESE